MHVWMTVLQAALMFLTSLITALQKVTRASMHWLWHSVTEHQSWGNCGADGLLCDAVLGFQLGGHVVYGRVQGCNLVCQVLHGQCKAQPAHCSLLKTGSETF